MTISSVHIYGPTATNSTRIRAFCPICKAKRYGSYTVYYDMDIATLDCGFQVASEAPIRGHYGPRNGHPIWRNKTHFKDWGWDFEAWYKRAGAWVQEYINWDDATNQEKR